MTNHNTKRAAAAAAAAEDRIRELDRFCTRLRFRASLYDKNGRIYSCDGDFFHDGERVWQSPSNGGADRQIDLDSLVNGHGTKITFSNA